MFGLPKWVLYVAAGLVVLYVMKKRSSSVQVSMGIPQIVSVTPVGGNATFMAVPQ